MWRGVRERVFSVWHVVGAPLTGASEGSGHRGRSNFLHWRETKIQRDWGIMCVCVGEEASDEGLGHWLRSMILPLW